MYTVLDYFEKTAAQYPEKAAFSDTAVSLSFASVLDTSKRIATTLTELGAQRRPIAILLLRTASVPSAMLGVAYSGNIYAVLDPDSPVERLAKIIEQLEPAAILTEEALYSQAEKLSQSKIPVLFYEDCCRGGTDNAALDAIRADITAADALCIICTSGSTGTPKGVVLTHRNIISYSEWFTQCFGINSTTVFGAQTPFYFSMSVSDVFACLFTGAQYVLIPKSYFTFPAPLVAYLNSKGVNTLYWVPAAYGVFSKLDLLSDEKIENLQLAMFAGEEMLVKYLNYFVKHQPEATYANLFGPTETTDIFAYYIVDRAFSENEKIPVGKPCANCRVEIVDGEMYVSGDIVAAGYYADPKKSAKVFVQNPKQNSYREIMYKTGDLAETDANGILWYKGRADFQIKRMGYRIEPGEIENAVRALEGVYNAVCVYVSDKLVLFYEGRKITDEQVRVFAAKRLPAYMMPDMFVKKNVLPLSQSGKTDRKALKEEAAVLIG